MEVRVSFAPCAWGPTSSWHNLFREGFEIDDSETGFLDRTSYWGKQFQGRETKVDTSGKTTLFSGDCWIWRSPLMMFGRRLTFLGRNNQVWHDLERAAFCHFALLSPNLEPEVPQVTSEPCGRGELLHLRAMTTSDLGQADQSTGCCAHSNIDNMDAWGNFEQWSGMFSDAPHAGIPIFQLNNSSLEIPCVQPN